MRWPCTVGRTVLAGSHDYVHATRLDRLSGPGSTWCRQTTNTIAWQRWLKFSIVWKSTPPSNHLSTASHDLSRFGDLSSCVKLRCTQHTRSCLPGTIQGGKWRNHTFQRLIWHCKQQSGSHLHGQSTWIYFSNFPMEEKRYDLRSLMAKFKYNLRSYYIKK